MKDNKNFQNQCRIFVFIMCGVFFFSLLEGLITGSLTLGRSTYYYERDQAKFWFNALYAAGWCMVLFAIGMKFSLVYNRVKTFFSHLNNDSKRQHTLHRYFKIVVIVGMIFGVIQIFFDAKIT